MKIGVLCNSKLSIPSVQFLVQSGHQVAMVLAAGAAANHDELEEFARYFQLPVLKVEKSNLDQEILFWNASNQFDVLFVITFPHILSKRLIASVGIPIINFHFAPLPQYKGAQPAFWMIKNGEKNGGITAHVITEKIDEGPIIHFESYKLSKNETFGSYHTKMASLNVTAIQKVLLDISNELWQKKVMLQNKSKAHYYSKPQLNDIRINWQTMTAAAIEQLCRACNPWNKGAITILNNYPLKLVEVQVIKGASKTVPAGQISRMEDSGKMAVATCDEKYLEVTIAYDDQMGFFSGERLLELGFRVGVVLN